MHKKKLLAKFKKKKITAFSNAVFSSHLSTFWAEEIFKGKQGVKDELQLLSDFFCLRDSSSTIMFFEQFESLTVGDKTSWANEYTL